MCHETPAPSTRQASLWLTASALGLKHADLPERDSCGMSRVFAQLRQLRSRCSFRQPQHPHAHLVLARLWTAMRPRERAPRARGGARSALLCRDKLVEEHACVQGRRSAP